MPKKVTRRYRTTAFIKELAANFRELGQVAPSSKNLSRKLITPLDSLQGTRRILEVGPGTGVVTLELVKGLKKGDELIICEINPRLLEIVKLKVERFKLTHSVEEKITYICSPVQELQEKYPANSFDAVVSSLPFTNFSAELVVEVLDLYKSLLRPGGVLTFYEYLGLRKVGQIFRNSKNRTRVKEVDQTITLWERNLGKEKLLKRDISLFNFPPAKVVVAKPNGQRH